MTGSSITIPQIPLVVNTTPTIFAFYESLVTVNDDSSNIYFLCRPRVANFDYSNLGFL
jgi:hypothetical protein